MHNMCSKYIFARSSDKIIVSCNAQPYATPSCSCEGRQATEDGYVYGALGICGRAYIFIAVNLKEWYTTI